jgi:hypothetical protein
MRGNSGEAAQSEPFAGMPLEPHLLNPDLRLERRALERRELLRSLTQLCGRAAAASIDFRWRGGRVDRALEFLDSVESDELPDNILAIRLATIREMIEDMSGYADLKRRESRDLRVMGQSGDSSPGAGANQPLGPATSPTCAVLVESREDRAEEPERHGKRANVPGEDRAPQEAPRRAKRPRKGEEEWVAPQAATKRHFTHYVLLNMVYRVATNNPTESRRTGYEINFGCWKQADFLQPYLSAHRSAPDPGQYWNGKLPGGLAAFWGKAKGIRLAKRTMEAEGRNEADVTAWVEQQVLGLSAMTDEDRQTFGQPATNAVTLLSTAFVRRPPCPPCPPCVLSFCASSISSRALP